MPVVLRAAGISPFFGFAGANMMFFPMGNVARRTGYMRLRRSTVDAPVTGSLSARSRGSSWPAARTSCGRSKAAVPGRASFGPPRYGLLRYLVDAVESVEGPEAMIVPTSIVYDQLPPREVAVTTSEALGHRKRPENLRWLLSYAVTIASTVGASVRRCR